MKLKRHINFVNESKYNLNVDLDLLDIIKKASIVLGEYNIKKNYNLNEVYDVDFEILNNFNIFISIQNEESFYETGIYIHDEHSLNLDVSVNTYESFYKIMMELLFDLHVKSEKYKIQISDDPNSSSCEDDMSFGEFTLPDTVLNSNYFKSKKSISKFNL